MRIAVIPARGGSKRIPFKNIRDFCGKPIIAWTIDAAINSACFDQVIVSTDNNEIAEIAKHYGAEAPFVRPTELSNDFAGTSIVIGHAIKWYISHGIRPDSVCCIYATAPFVSIYDIRAGCAMIEDKNCDFAFSATAFAAPVQRAFRLTADGGLRMLNPECFDMRSQDLDQTYHDAGQFYWARSETWLNNEFIFGPRSRIVLIPKYRVHDIDDLDDWKRAELMFDALNKTLIPSYRLD